jgi:hypothetical protein
MQTNLFNTIPARALAGVCGGAIRFTSETGESLVRGSRGQANQKLTRFDRHHRLVGKYSQNMFGDDWGTFSNRRGDACVAYPGGRHIACVDHDGHPAQFWRK